MYPKLHLKKHVLYRAFEKIFTIIIWWTIFSLSNPSIIPYFDWKILKSSAELTESFLFQYLWIENFCQFSILWQNLTKFSIIGQNLSGFSTIIQDYNWFCTCCRTKNSSGKLRYFSEQDDLNYNLIWFELRSSWKYLK